MGKQKKFEPVPEEGITRPSKRRVSYKEAYRQSRELEKELAEAETKKAEAKQEETNKKAREIKSGRLLQYAKDAWARNHPGEKQPAKLPEVGERAEREIVRLIGSKLQPLIVKKDLALASLANAKEKINGLMEEDKVHQKNIIRLRDQLTQDLKKNLDGAELRKEIKLEREKSVEIEETLAALQESRFVEDLERDCKIAQSEVNTKFSKLLYENNYNIELQRFVNSILRVLFIADDYGEGVKRYSQRSGISAVKFGTIKAYDELKKHISNVDSDRLRGYLENYY